MKREGCKRGGGIFFPFSFHKKEKWCLVMMHRKNPIFSFSRTNILFSFLLYDWKFGMDGMGGTAEKCWNFFIFLLGRVSFPFFVECDI